MVDVGPHGMMLEQPAPAAARGVHAASSRPAAGTTPRERLGSLTMPTHVIGGEYDILVPVWKSRELAELIPGARLDGPPGRAARR